MIHYRTTPGVTGVTPDRSEAIISDTIEEVFGYENRMELSSLPNVFVQTLEYAASY
jgi:hypothetical protein